MPGTMKCKECNTQVDISPDCEHLDKGDICHDPVTPCPECDHSYFEIVDPA